MDLTFRKATVDDIDLLTKTRIEVLRAANRLPVDTDMGDVEKQSRLYYEKALRDGTHTACLVFDRDRWVGAGGISYYQVMPTYHNPSGNKAYIMNMYTHPEYRRQGIAFRMLDLLVGDARSKQIAFISLEATAMGRPLYEKYGFVPMDDEMILEELHHHRGTASDLVVLPDTLARDNRRHELIQISAMPCRPTVVMKAVGAEVGGHTNTSTARTD